jgi:mannosyl-oligosaccharide alpha-1,3-glucosidase
MSSMLIQPYYDFFDYTTYKGKGHHTIPAPLGRIPLLVRGGSIIPRKDRARGSSGRMSRDPYTLFITLSEEVLSRGTTF